MRIAISVAAKTRLYMSIQHIQSAAHYARLSHAVEKSNDGKFSDERIADYRAYVTGSIFASVSFLEAAINDVFADAAENTGPHSRHNQLPSETRRLMSEMWTLGIPRTASFTSLRKYQAALTMAGKAMFDTSALAYQDAASLIALRNALIHYEPEWLPVALVTATEGPKPHRLEARLKAKFPLSPITNAGNPFFPDRCLSHGCARWAVVSSVKFADEFFARMGLRPTYDHVRQRLQTE